MRHQKEQKTASRVNTDAIRVEAVKQGLRRRDPSAINLFLNDEEIRNVRLNGVQSVMRQPERDYSRNVVIYRERILLHTAPNYLISMNDNSLSPKAIPDGRPNAYYVQQSTCPQGAVCYSRDAAVEYDEDVVVPSSLPILIIQSDGPWIGDPDVYGNIKWKQNSLITHMYQSTAMFYTWPFQPTATNYFAAYRENGVVIDASIKKVELLLHGSISGPHTVVYDSVSKKGGGSLLYCQSTVETPIVLSSLPTTDQLSLEWLEGPPLNLSYITITFSTWRMERSDQWPLLYYYLDFNFSSLVSFVEPIQARAAIKAKVDFWHSMESYR